MGVVMLITCAHSAWVSRGSTRKTSGCRERVVRVMGPQSCPTNDAVGAGRLLSVESASVFVS
jgi:hypothetical protein